jgi:hypothetical protein
MRRLVLAFLALVTVPLAVSLVIDRAEAGVILIAGGRGASETGGSDPGPIGDSVLGLEALDMTPGEWREITSLLAVPTDYLMPNAIGSLNSPVIEFTSILSYDPIQQELYVIGCSRGSEPSESPPFSPGYECGGSDDNDAGYVIYDITDNSWSRNTTSDINSNPHPYGESTINPNDGTRYYWETTRNNGDRTMKCAGPCTNAWTSVWTHNEGGMWSHAASHVYFGEPDELVFVDGGEGFAPQLCYAAEATPTSYTCQNVSTLTLDANGYSQFGLWSDLRNLVYFGGGTNNENNVGTFSASHVETVMEDSPVDVGHYGASGKTVIDPANGNLVAFGNNPPNIWELDPTVTSDGTWTDIGDHPITVSGSDEMYAVMTHIPELCVVVVWSHRPDEVWLWKPPACSS